ncbi:dihydrolipoamide succinyltransferase [Hyphomicrobium methylovorum]|uniref:2-oxoglutarate dehydrogenase complex dihydrolipoyllysine-residue succinyltransferase n=1 Tax=Hyphomicrobium methylovorum TaxID=84 RepID=UPI0015E77373|nr:2-oxoglutarate dehydrogenase complex dihydrolipoyllysine-residue succinyltransferase [Hyphomicrobium methylovorum]MBA2126084.1 dihydrolipoamide succinyltransferase [Hyphomicrobium methylovorum]
MSIEIRVPTLGESVTEATVGKWFKTTGETVNADEPLVELETDKVTVEVPAPASGVLGDILVQSGSTVAVGSVLAALNEGKGGAAAAPTAAPQPPEPKPQPQSQPEPKPAPTSAKEPAPAAASGSEPSREVPPPTPAALRAMMEAGLEPSDVQGSGRRGQILKEDIANALAAAAPRQAPPPPPRAPEPAAAQQTAVALKQTPTTEFKAMQDARLPSPANDETREERLKMTRLRQTIARRLKEAQNTAAMLTTFNDVDMSAVMALRAQYKDAFEKRHGVKLGFMGLFVKACIQALRDVPSVNAEIDGDEIVYKNYYHLGVAVGTEKGLVVPVVRDADRLTLAEIEQQIHAFGKRARDGKLSIDDMQGGTFTISNGGVYGSLMSTPILNAPQSGILGMHRIEERPVVRGGQIVARPMMYLALSYDHRIVDGKEAVTFLVRVKECLEDPQRFILEL